MIVLQAHIDFLKIEIYVHKKFQKIFILIIMNIYIKNAIFLARLVTKQELIQIIIAILAKMIIYINIKAIVIKNAHLI